MLASVRQRGKALQDIFRISLQNLWEPVGEHFKLTDVLEFGRPCIRLRLGFIGQVLENGGSEMVRGGRGLPLLLNLDRVHQKTKRSIAGLKATSLRGVSTSGRYPWQTQRTHRWISSVSLGRPMRCELVQLRLLHCRQPRLDNVDGCVVILRWEALDHRPHQTRPRARLEWIARSTLCSPIDTKLRGAPTSTHPIVSAGSASPFSNMLWSLCLHSFASAIATSHTLFVYAATKPLWHQRRFIKQHRQISVVDSARPLERCKVKSDLRLQTLHFSLNGEIEVVGFKHALLRDVLDAVDASNAYVHFSDCLVDAVNMEELLHNSATACFVERLARTREHQLASWQRACRRCRRAT